MLYYTLAKYCLNFPVFYTKTKIKERNVMNDSPLFYFKNILRIARVFLKIQIYSLKRNWSIHIGYIS